MKCQRMSLGSSGDLSSSSCSAGESRHNEAVLPLSAAPVGRGVDGVDAMACMGNMMMMRAEQGRVMQLLSEGGKRDMPAARVLKGAARKQRRPVQQLLQDRRHRT
jgi:hypothetical protein